jgi:hypothetical protein
MQRATALIPAIPLVQTNYTAPSSLQWVEGLCAELERTKLAEPRRTARLQPSENEQDNDNDQN